MESTPPKSYFFSFPGCASRGFLSSSLGAGTACQRPAGVRRTWAGRSPEVPTTRFRVLHSRKSHPHRFIAIIAAGHPPAISHQPPLTSHLSLLITCHRPPATHHHHSSPIVPSASNQQRFATISSFSPLLFLPATHQSPVISHLWSFIHQSSPITRHSLLTTHHSPLTIH